MEPRTSPKPLDRRASRAKTNFHGRHLRRASSDRGGQSNRPLRSAQQDPLFSQGVANVASVASVAIAAHELGHAMQDAEDYFPLRFRSALVPVVNIGSNLGWILIMVGLFLKFTELAWLGVLVFAGGAVFALATLPVEFNASARAKQLLVQTGIIQTDEEQRGVNAVLNAAALTYVAGLITAVLQLVYYASLVGGGRRR